MTNQTILTLLNYICNEARNSVQASFGLMALCPTLAPNPAWQTCIENSKYGADRLLRCIDDIRELLSTETPQSEPVEEFDLTLCLGETIEVLNLASGDRASRLILQPATRAVTGRQHRRAVEQVLMRVLDAVSKLGKKGDALVTAAPSTDGDGVQFEIIPANSNIAVRVADWLNSDPDQCKLRRLRRGALRRRHNGGRQAHSRARRNGRVRVRRTRADGVGGHPSLASRHATEGPSEASRQNETGLSVLVAEDSDESFLLTGILLQKESVWRARDGLEAVDMMKTRRFDVVLMDVHMPGMDGYKAIRSMRDWETQTGNARTPIVVLSSDDSGHTDALCGPVRLLRISAQAARPP